MYPNFVKMSFIAFTLSLLNPLGMSFLEAYANHEPMELVEEDSLLPDELVLQILNLNTQPQAGLVNRQWNRVQKSTWLENQFKPLLRDAQASSWKNPDEWIRKFQLIEGKIRREQPDVLPLYFKEFEKVQILSSHLSPNDKQILGSSLFAIGSEGKLIHLYSEPALGDGIVLESVRFTPLVAAPDFGNGIEYKDVPFTYRPMDHSLFFDQKDLLETSDQRKLVRVSYLPQKWKQQFGDCLDSNLVNLLNTLEKSQALKKLISLNYQANQVTYRLQSENPNPGAVPALRTIDLTLEQMECVRPYLDELILGIKDR